MSLACASRLREFANRRLCVCCAVQAGLAYVGCGVVIYIRNDAIVKFMMVNNGIIPAMIDTSRCMLYSFIGDDAKMRAVAS